MRTTGFGGLGTSAEEQAFLDQARAAQEAAAASQSGTGWDTVGRVANAVAQALPQVVPVITGAMSNQPPYRQQVQPRVVGIQPGTAAQSSGGSWWPWLIGGAAVLALGGFVKRRSS